MKRITLSMLLISSLMVGYGCSSHKDSNQAAQDANEKKVDEGTVSTATDSKSDTKDVTEYLVDLTNTGRTEYELSKLAEQKATNASVKAYASQTVKMHQQDEAELKSEATKRNITLPTTLSSESQEMLTKLGGEKTGHDFDQKYLDDMADVNDKAISRARKLLDTSEDGDLKSYIQKVMSDDQGHMDKAKKLKEALR